jgi:hypothetical protein
MFVTLTGPSFGRVHHAAKTAKPWRGARKGAKRRGRACRCGAAHGPDDGVAGTPLDAGSYDYAAQVAWNHASSRLLTRACESARHHLGKVPWIAVAEDQKRGCVHFHVMVLCPAGTTAATMKRAFKAMRETGAEGIKWGRQCDLEVVAPGRRRLRIGGYLAKLLGYSAKDLGRDKLSGRWESAARREHLERLDRAARAYRCHRPCCQPAEAEAKDPVERVRQRERRRGRTYWYGHKRYGFAGQRMRRSRNWPAPTLAALRDERRQWRIARGCEDLSSGYRWEDQKPGAGESVLSSLAGRAGPRDALEDLKALCAAVAVAGVEGPAV